MVAGIIILTGILFTALLLYVHIAHPLSFYTFLGRYIKRVMEAFNAKFLIQSNGLFVPKDILVKPVQINKYCSGTEQTYLLAFVHSYLTLYVK